jgi:lipoyl(octanoyl) transferase
MRTTWILNLPSVPYAEALELQHRIVNARKRGALHDVMILLEHPPVFTLGRNAKDANVLASPDFIKQLGIETFRVERGGDVTYHGPNQLVGYPILDLRNYRQDVGWYVRSLEETLIRALGDFGIQARRIEKLVGVWVDVPNPQSPFLNGMGAPDTSLHPVEESRQRSPAKLAQIGARIENWITYHGFALNVDPNMMHFDLIVPCGISDKAVTSMARVLDRTVGMRDVREHVAAQFAEVFGTELVEISREEFEARLREVELSPTTAS